MGKSKEREAGLSLLGMAFGAYGVALFASPKDVMAPVYLLACVIFVLVGLGWLLVWTQKDIQP